MAESIEDIYNYAKVTEAIATAGQPTADQFVLIRDAGYQVLINLALPTSPNALEHERDLVEQLGLEYVAIPVEWDAPQQADVETFFQVMEANRDRRIFIHCAANKRVSAFLYLYRVLCHQTDPGIALIDLHRIWSPNEIWQPFIDGMINLYRCK